MNRRQITMTVQYDLDNVFHVADRESQLEPDVPRSVADLLIDMLQRMSYDVTLVSASNDNPHLIDRDGVIEEAKYCQDPRHTEPCPLPCPACADECQPEDKKR